MGRRHAPGCPRGETIRSRKGCIADLAPLVAKTNRILWKGRSCRAKITRGGLIKIGRGRLAFKIHPRELESKL